MPTPPAPHTDAGRRHDFVLLFDVTDGNPNGDPDAGNMPRTDPETGHGLVSDVCVKRKVRDYVTLAAQDATGERRAALNIYIEHRGVLNAQHRKAYDDLKIPTSAPATQPVSKELQAVFEALPLPEGFRLIESEDDGEPPTLEYSGELDKGELKQALDLIGTEGSAEARRFADSVAKKAKSYKAKREEVEKAQGWMCRHFYDVRMFGAVMSTGINAGQVRGPAQLTFARSADPVFPRDLAVARVAITKEDERESKETTFGRKTLVHYGLYRAHGFFTPHFASATGVTSDDLALLWEALEGMWALDRSASRGLMACRGLYVFSHERKLGNAHAHDLFSRVKVARRGQGGPDASERAPVELDGPTFTPRTFEDYTVAVDEAGLPAGVTLTTVVA